MKNIYLLFLLILSIACSPKRQVEEPQAALPITELQLIQAYEILESNFEGRILEPSGIVSFQDTLFFISDNHDASIFMLEQQEDAMRWKEALRFEAPLPDLDIEGLSIDSAGTFYLVSEKHNQIIEVNPNTGLSKRIGTDIKALLPEGSPLLEQKNAKLEGISLKNDSTFLLAAERSERGIIEVQFKEKGQYRSDLKLIQAETYSTSKIGAKLRMDGSLDFADIFHLDNQTYALDRNAQAIILIKESADLDFEGSIWSYRQTAKSYGYKGKGLSEMGTAEGLYMDQEKIYLIFDNNKRKNKHFGTTNPILLIFKRP